MRIYFLTLNQAMHFHVVCYAACNARGGTIGRYAGATVGHGCVLRKDRHVGCLHEWTYVVTTFAICFFTRATKQRCWRPYVASFWKYCQGSEVAARVTTYGLFLLRVALSALFSSATWSCTTALCHSWKSRTSLIWTWKGSESSQDKAEFE